MKKQKKFLIVVAAFFVLIFLIVLGCFIAFEIMTSKIESRYITVACAEVAEDGSFEWEDEERRSVWNCYPYSLAFLFTARTDRTEAILGDVELAEFCFSDKNFEPIYNFYVAYDYALKNIYIKKQDKWYRLKDTDTIDKIIKNSMENSYVEYEMWRAQSIYGLENWVNVDVNDLVFRYYTRWGCSYKPSAKDDYRDSGFKNIHPTVIETKNQAIARAAQELGYENPVGVVFYDETCGYWMVELYETPIENVWTDMDEYGHFLHSNVYTVIMDAQGITLETYQNVSHYKPFYLELVNDLK